LTIEPFPTRLTLCGGAASSSHPNAAMKSPTLVFRLSCWMLGVIAFAQLISAGVALAMRVESGRAVKIVEKEVPSAPAVVLNRPVEAPAPPLMTLEHRRETPPPAPAAVPVLEVMADHAPSLAPLPMPRPLEIPTTADPVTERLVKEARAARLAEDMLNAITKLEQALQQSPNDAMTLFEMGQCLETMGIYDRARQFYNRVFQLGTTGAGQLYQQAADKLRQGFEQPQDKINRIVLGRVRVFKAPVDREGQKVVITIPVQTVPGEQIEGRDLEVIVNFFDEIGARKEIKPADTMSCKVASKWITEPLDWSGGEELLQVSYLIPPQDAQQDHLFGEKRYHGQVVELSYKGELIDAQAWPRILAHKLNKPDAPPVFLDQEMPNGYNPDNPLLPNAPGGAPPDYSQQDLPPPPADFPPDDATPLPVPPEYQNLPQR
jgi:hypothetical protein